jgi:dienelactone hydrolase
MAEILLFHHAQGLTGGCLAFAEELRGAGHVVHAPDLYPGDRHLFTDFGLRDHAAEAAALLRTRVLLFLDGLA